MTTHGVASDQGARVRNGFSMVEIIIAITILSIGVVGMAGATGQIIRQITLADLLTERSVAFQTVIDRLQSLPFDSVGAGADSIGIYSVTWSSTPDGAQSKIVRIVTTGPGITTTTFAANDPQKVESFDFRILRR